MTSLSSLPFDIPSDEGGGWIAPYYAQVFEAFGNGESPYSTLLEILTYLYYPKTTPGFRVQLWVLIGLFIFTMSIIVLGLALRAYQGRMWLFHRMDRTVVIPGGALFPICALTYAALGLLVLVAAIQISNFKKPYPTWIIGLRAAWVGPLWTGIFFEVWACYAGWYIRRYGAHFRESTWKTIVALMIPVVVLLVAWVPPTILFTLGALDFNRSVRASTVVHDLLVDWNKTWTPSIGVDLPKFASLWEIGAQMGGGLLDYSDMYTTGSLYVAALLIVTLIAYLVGAALELNHLSRTIRRLKIEHNLGMPRPANNSNLLSPASAEGGGVGMKARISSVLRRASSSATRDIDAELDDEYARGQGRGRRQWILMEWVRTNRILTTACIAALLMAEIGLSLWKGFTNVGFETPSSQFKAEMLLSGWLNSILATLVSLLILFRSLDGSSPLVHRLRTILPFLPFPPSLERLSPTSISASMSMGPPKHRVYNGEKTVVREEPIVELRIHRPTSPVRIDMLGGDDEKVMTEHDSSIPPPPLGDSKELVTIHELDKKRRGSSLTVDQEQQLPNVPSLSASRQGSIRIGRIPVPTLDKLPDVSNRSTSPSTSEEEEEDKKEKSSSSTSSNALGTGSSRSSLVEDDDSAVDKDQK